MKQILSRKLQASEPYTREELGWLLEHVGDDNPEIRDDLTYASFSHALLDNLVTTIDFSWLVEQIIKQNFLFYKIEETGEATLTRFFAALLAALLIGLDGDQQSIYTASLSQKQKNILFQQALNYLKVECDSTGWSDDYGWVHAFAHGADFLLYASQHPDFPESYEEVWEVIINILKKQSSIFTANEEKRLAMIISQLILQGKITQQDLLNWLSNTNFPNIETKDYLCWINYQNFLMTIYLDLDQSYILEQNVKEKLQEFCSL